MNIAFIGFGNMARALAEGFVRMGALTPAEIGACARDAEKLRRNTEPHGFRAFATAEEAVASAEVVFLAVKPHQIEAVVAPIRELLVGKIVISVAASWTFARYESIFLPGTHHLSTGPNTPVSVGEGIIACERTHSLSDAEWQAMEQLLGRVGVVILVDTPLLGVAGTICGCSPAFTALFMEALSDAAVKHGIPRADAYRMVSQMLVGTGKLQLATGAHPGTLKDAVCSPGGTTIVGIAELEHRGFRGVVIDAVDAIEKHRR